MKVILKHAILAVAVGLSPAAFAEKTDCSELAQVVKKQVSAKPDSILEIVEQQTAGHPSCACEVVKAAIVSSEADGTLVGQIVATAIEAAPDRINVIKACAIAVAPDALPQIKEVLSELNPKSVARKGDDPVGGAKDAKGAKGVIASPKVKSPLDEIYLIPGLPPIHPPLVPSISTPGDFPSVGITTGTQSQ